MRSLLCRTVPSEVCWARLGVCIAAALLGTLLCCVPLAAGTGLTGNSTPVNVSVSPSGGSMAGPARSVVTVFSDPDGYADIRKVYFMINDSLGQTNALFMMYDCLANKFYLKNDANTSWGTGYAPDTAITLENSQGWLTLTHFVPVGSGNELTVTWVVQLKEPFASKALNGYMYVQDNGGLHDGWEQMALYHNVAPEVVSIDPDDYIYIDPPDPMQMNTVYRDANGADDVQKCYLLINETLSMTNAIFLLYHSGTNKMYLRDDANTTWGTGQIPGSMTSLNNSQCSVYVNRSAVEELGNDLTVSWSITPLASMAGKNLYGWMYVTDSTGAASGYKKVGTYFTPTAPVCLSLSPTSGTVNTGVETPFMAIYSDDNGWPDIAKIYFQLSVTSSQANAVLVMYDAKTKKVYLKNDANTSWGSGGTPGSATILENSQCKVNMASMGPPPWWVTPDQLQVSWPIELKASQAGKKLCERMYVSDNEGLNSGWKVMGYVDAL